MAEATKRNFLWLGLGGLVVAVAGGALYSGTGAAAYEVRFMTPSEMQADGALVVDVRTPGEWQDTGVIAGAKLVTFADPKSFLTQIQGALKPGQDLVLVCHSGRRSAAAAEQLAGLIPNHIISIDGGMSRVISSGYQTVAPQL